MEEYFDGRWDEYPELSFDYSCLEAFDGCRDLEVSFDRGCDQWLERSCVEIGCWSIFPFLMVGDATGTCCFHFLTADATTH